jgi:hypothetical protein
MPEASTDCNVPAFWLDMCEDISTDDAQCVTHRAVDCLCSGRSPCAPSFTQVLLVVRSPKWG